MEIFEHDKAENKGYFSNLGLGYLKEMRLKKETIKGSHGVEIARSACYKYNRNHCLPKVNFTPWSVIN